VTQRAGRAENRGDRGAGAGVRGLLGLVGVGPAPEAKGVVIAVLVWLGCPGGIRRWGAAGG
jgi:hypothetical protein